jgi:hypothetical protein
MVVRVHTQFHTSGQRTPAALASVAALLSWKLAVDSIQRMRRADYAIDIGRQYFDFVCEFMVFLAVAADRIAYRELDEEGRVAFTTALVKRLAEMVEENHYLLMGEDLPGGLKQHFLTLFNRRSADYAEFDYGAEGPDFGFRRYFASCLRDVLPEKDKLWVVDQAMDIEVPEALKSLNKALPGMFHPETQQRRVRDGATAGD